MKRNEVSITFYDIAVARSAVLKEYDVQLGHSAGGGKSLCDTRCVPCFLAYTSLSSLKWPAPRAPRVSPQTRPYWGAEGKSQVDRYTPLFSELPGLSDHRRACWEYPRKSTPQEGASSLTFRGDSCCIDDFSCGSEAITLVQNSIFHTRYAPTLLLVSYWARSTAAEIP